MTTEIRRTLKASVAPVPRTEQDNIGRVSLNLEKHYYTPVLLCWSLGEFQDKITLALHSLSASSENLFCRVKGNLRFPLTFTYHGCPGLGSARLVQPKNFP